VFLGPSRQNNAILQVFSVLTHTAELHVCQDKKRQPPLVHYSVLDNLIMMETNYTFAILTLNYSNKQVIKGLSHFELLLWLQLMFLTQSETLDLSSLEEGSRKVRICKSNFLLLLTWVMASSPFKADLSLILGKNC